MFCRIIRIGNSITNTRVLNVFNGSRKEAYLSGLQRIYIDDTGLKVAYFRYFKFCAGSHHANLHAFFDTAVDNADIQHYAFISVKFRVKYQSFQRLFRITVRGGHLCHDSFQNVLNTKTGLGTAQHRIRSVNADNIFYLFFYMLRVGTG